MGKGDVADGTDESFDKYSRGSEAIQNSYSVRFTADNVCNKLGEILEKFYLWRRLTVFEAVMSDPM